MANNNTYCKFCQHSLLMFWNHNHIIISPVIEPYLYSSSVMYQLARLLLLSVSSVVTFSHQQPEVPTDFLIRFVETFNMDYIIIIRNGSGLSWFKVLWLFYIFCFNTIKVGFIVKLDRHLFDITICYAGMISL